MFSFFCEKLVCFKRDQHTQSKQINLVLCIIRHIPSRYACVHDDIKAMTGILSKYTNSKSVRIKIFKFF